MTADRELLRRFGFIEGQFGGQTLQVMHTLGFLDSMRGGEEIGGSVAAYVYDLISPYYSNGSMPPQDLERLSRLITRPLPVEPIREDGYPFATSLRESVISVHLHPNHHLSDRTGVCYALSDRQGKVSSIDVKWRMRDGMPLSVVTEAWLGQPIPGRRTRIQQRRGISNRFEPNMIFHGHGISLSEVMSLL